MRLFNLKLRLSVFQLPLLLKIIRRLVKRYPAFRVEFTETNFCFKIQFTLSKSKVKSKVNHVDEVRRLFKHYAKELL